MPPWPGATRHPPPGHGHAALPEMPEQKLEKLRKQYGVNEKNAELLARNIELVEFFELVAEKIDGKRRSGNSADG